MMDTLCKKLTTSGIVSDGLSQIIDDKEGRDSRIEEFIVIQYLRQSLDELDTTFLLN